MWSKIILYFQILYYIIYSKFKIMFIFWSHFVQTYLTYIIIDVNIVMYSHVYTCICMYFCFVRTNPQSTLIFGKRPSNNMWSIYTSRYIIALSVLLDDYTTVYACYWQFSCKNLIHLYTFSSDVFQNMCWFRAIKLFKCQKEKKIFQIGNTQYSVA